MGVATVLGVVLRRYIDFLMLHNPYSSCICTFLQQHPYFLVHFLNVFRSLYIYTYQRNAPANSSKRGSLRLTPNM